MATWAIDDTVSIGISSGQAAVDRLAHVCLFKYE
jgi:hypothetical protein